MVMEFWPAGLRRSGGSADELLALLCDLGFRLWNPDKRAQPLPKPPWAEENKP